MKLFAGPWVGEFGWELFCWQARVRHIAKKYDRVIVTCQTGHEYLYEDFASEIRNYNRPATSFPDCNYCIGIDIRNCVPIPDGYDHLCPIDIRVEAEPVFHIVDEQDYIHLDMGEDQVGYDIVCHARNRVSGTSYRNWPIEMWMAFAKELDYRVAWIGTPDEAHAFGGGDDLRGVGLRYLAGVVSRSKLVVGPSSGPMHFASLCGTPHVVWSGNSADVCRYKTYWNPFQVRHEFISSWAPTVDEVLGCVRRMLQ